jgi:hypothetical protein
MGQGTLGLASRSCRDVYTCRNFDLTLDGGPEIIVTLYTWRNPMNLNKRQLGTGGFEITTVGFEAWPPVMEDGCLAGGSKMTKLPLRPSGARSRRVSTGLTRLLSTPWGTRKKLSAGAGGYPAVGKTVRLS